MRPMRHQRRESSREDVGAGEGPDEDAEDEGEGGRLAPVDAIAALEDCPHEGGSDSDIDAEVAAELQEEWAGALAAADAREADVAKAGGADGLAPPAPPVPPPPAGPSGSASSSGAGSIGALAPAAEPSELREIPGGYIMRGNHRIGRVAVQASFGLKSSAQVVCYRHTRCSVWVTLNKVPDVSRLRTWVGEQNRFLTAREHLAEFNTIVYGG